jgi:tRNA nucleotidyltransferase (CCA-adding enzyme)
MKIYLVGGAVRDKLLNIPVKDRDWVVLNATPETMLAKGFLPVGQDFPVFLHPATKEEYALARTERKSGHGYKGFTFHTSPDVTLQEDLARRDLTINAIAEDEQGNLIDPYGGQNDLKQKQLRHVSSAFQEDPLRILRVARFAARFHSLGFEIAPETLSMMQAMVNSGEASYLVVERVWQETLRALAEPAPEIYFKTLFDCQAMGTVLQEWIPFLQEGSTGLNALKKAASMSAREVIRFAVTFAPNPTQSLEELKTLFTRVRCPSDFSDLATLTFQHCEAVMNDWKSLDGEGLMTLFEKTDAVRRPERFSDFLESVSFIGEAANSPLPKAKRLQLIELLSLCRQMNAREIVAQGFKGKEVGKQLCLARIKAINHHLED